MSCMFVSSRLMSALWLPRSAIRTLERRCRRGDARAWRRGLLDPYRPELHYMRGPGPKWREKNRREPDRQAGPRDGPGSRGF
jgi:hypothetical protein